MGLLYEKEARASGDKALPDIKGASTNRAKIVLDDDTDGFEAWGEQGALDSQQEVEVLDELDSDDAFDD